jgi:chlorite dismutase
MPDPTPTLHSFAGGELGLWRVDAIARVIGEPLTRVPRLDVRVGSSHTLQQSAWVLQGTSSNARYTSAQEQESLTRIQAGLGRPEALRAALIPIRKSPAWWALAQDQRRAILEEQSRHIRIGMEYLPAIARKLIHCRDLGGEFDFLTWFEYAPEHAPAFEELVRRLRETKEWEYVDREVDIRLCRGRVGSE